MKKKNVFWKIFAAVLYVSFGYLCAVFGDKTASFFPGISYYYVLIVHLGIAASSCITIFGLYYLAADNANALGGILKMSVSILVFALCFFVLALMKLNTIWLIVLPLVTTILFLFVLNKLEEKFWNPIYTIEKKYLFFRIRHEKDSSKVRFYQERFKNLACARMLTLIDSKERLYNPYYYVEILALKLENVAVGLRTSAIKRREKLSSLSRELYAREASDLAKSIGA